MCLAIPGRVMEIADKLAIVDFGGVRQKVRLDLLKDVFAGDYVLVHVGFAIQKVEREDALETLRILKELGYGTDWVDVGPGG